MLLTHGRADFTQATLVKCFVDAGTASTSCRRTFTRRSSSFRKPTRSEPANYKIGFVAQGYSVSTEDGNSIWRLQLQRLQTLTEICFSN